MGVSDLALLCSLLGKCVRESKQYTCPWESHYSCILNSIGFGFLQHALIEWLYKYCTYCSMYVVLMEEELKKEWLLCRQFSAVICEA